MIRIDWTAHGWRVMEGERVEIISQPDFTLWLRHRDIDLRFRMTEGSEGFSAAWLETDDLDLDQFLLFMADEVAV